MRSISRLIMCLALGAMLGCQAGMVPRQEVSRRPADQIDGLQLNAAVMPLAEAGQLPKGLGVTLYPYRGNVPVAVANRVQVLMFEGLVSADVVRQTGPTRQWEFTAEELAPTFGPGDFGLKCYHIPLMWGANRPRSDVITLVARYIPYSGPPVYSGVCTVRLGAI